MVSCARRCVLNPKLSVVVPIYNVEPYLRECLASLAAQTLRELEVIMVDDGSTDGSAALADEMAAEDGRFRLVVQENQGLGPARNTGVRHATGEYLAFVDSDDVVPPRAYELLIRSLEETGSDFASGNVERLEIGGMTTQSALHRGLAAAKRTHVSRDHRLLRDRTAWNKVFRRGFWDEHGFAFPAGWYEDSPVMLPAHVAAASVDVIAEPVYRWRRRLDSISEGRAGVDNLSARIAVMRGVRDGLPAVYHDDFDRILLEVDLEILLRSLPGLAEADQRTLAAQVAPLAAAIAPEVLARRPAAERICLMLMATGRFEELRQVLADQRDLGGVRLRSKGGRFYADYPFAGEAYDVTDDLRPKADVEKAWWQDGLLHLIGRAYLPGVPTSSLKVWLRPSGRVGSAVRIDLPVTPTKNGSFSATIDPARLKLLGRWWQADWKLCVKVAGQGLERKHSFGCTGEALAAWPEPRQVSKGVGLLPVGGRGRFQLRVQPGNAAATPPADTDWRAVMEKDLLCSGLDPKTERKSPG